MNSIDIKRKLKEVNEDIYDLKTQKACINEQLSAKIERKHELEKKLKDIDEAAIEVTDHAIIRYLERVLNFNVDNIRNSILNDKMLHQIERIESGKFPHEEGYKVLVKNKKVITIIPKE